MLRPEYGSVDEAREDEASNRAGMDKDHTEGGRDVEGDPYYGQHERPFLKERKNVVIFLFN